MCGEETCGFCTQIKEQIEDKTGTFKTRLNSEDATMLWNEDMKMHWNEDMKFPDTERAHPLKAKEAKKSLKSFEAVAKRKASG